MREIDQTISEQRSLIEIYAGPITELSKKIDELTNIVQKYALMFTIILIVTVFVFIAVGVTQEKLHRLASLETDSELNRVQRTLIGNNTGEVDQNALEKIETLIGQRAKGHWTPQQRAQLNDAVAKAAKISPDDARQRVDEAENTINSAIQQTWDTARRMSTASGWFFVAYMFFAGGYGFRSFVAYNRNKGELVLFLNPFQSLLREISSLLDHGKLGEHSKLALRFQMIEAEVSLRRAERIADKSILEIGIGI